MLLYTVLASKHQKSIPIILKSSIKLHRTSSNTEQEFPNEFRKKDVPTDILSFPTYPVLKAGARIKAKDEWEKNLGDLILSPEYIHKAAIKLEERFEDRLKMLVIHGICHLLGYDHIEDKDYKKMHKKETELLKLIQ